MCLFLGVCWLLFYFHFCDSCLISVFIFCCHTVNLWIFIVTFCWCNLFIWHFTFLHAICLLLWHASFLLFPSLLCNLIFLLLSSNRCSCVIFLLPLIFPLLWLLLCPSLLSTLPFLLLHTSSSSLPHDSAELGRGRGWSRRTWAACCQYATSGWTPASCTLCPCWLSVRTFWWCGSSSALRTSWLNSAAAENDWWNVANVQEEQGNTDSLWCFWNCATVLWVCVWNSCTLILYSIYTLSFID